MNRLHFDLVASPLPPIPRGKQQGLTFLLLLKYCLMSLAQKFYLILALVLHVVDSSFANNLIVLIASPNTGPINLE